jgi:hypothetical protein
VHHAPEPEPVLSPEPVHHAPLPRAPVTPEVIPLQVGKSNDSVACAMLLRAWIRGMLVWICYVETCNPCRTSSSVRVKLGTSQNTLRRRWSFHLH